MISIKVSKRFYKEIEKIKKEFLKLGITISNTKAADIILSRSKGIIEINFKKVKDDDYFNRII